MKIALFLPNWIGDVVMATPAVRAIREHFRDAELIGVCKPYVAGVLEGSPWLDRLVLFDKKGPLSRRLLPVAWKLHREGVDEAVLFTNTFRSALAARLGGCARRRGYVRYGRRWLLTEGLEPVRDEKGKLLPSPIIKAYNLLAEKLGCPAPSNRMELFTTPADEEAADRVWRQTRLAGYPEVICLNPGAAFGSSKHWPTESFVQLAQDLADWRGSGVLVLCGPAERELAGHIVKLARRPAVQSLAEFPPSLGLTKACIRRADLLITTDSGPRHMAAAFERPVVTLFGPTHIAWTETWYPRAVHLQKEVPCGPCQLRKCPLDHRCMTTLTPKEVFQSAVELLARWPSAAQRRPA